MNIYSKMGGMITFLLITTMLFSCSNYLNVVPKDRISDATLWEDTSDAELFLNNIYASVPGLNIGDPLENYSDNAMNGVNNGYSRQYYATSVYTAENAPSEWGQYASIRECNLFIEKVNLSKLPDTWKKGALAEARFLRALFYMKMWCVYGGVPVITDVLNRHTQGDDIFRARNTSEETVKFIIDECTAIADDLPLSADAGRATRGAALTLKAWCELYDASPLNNPNDDENKWALAAASYKHVMDLGVYELFSDYAGLFLEANNVNKEVIFARQYLGGTSLGNGKVFALGPAFVNGSNTGFGESTPTQELVDSYEMANGLPITDPDSHYDPQHPYANREKRFYQSIIYDGSMWLGYEMVIKQGVGSKNATDLSDVGQQTNTGYYWRKGMDPKYASVGNNQNSAQYIIFRYAGVLLGYAEAQNEASATPDQSVYDAINKVRSRSDLPPLPSGLDQGQMREAIHRERRVEFAGDDNRWYDLLRWKIAMQKLNGSLHAIEIKKVGDKWMHEVIPAPGGERIFYEKNYRLPIPQSAIDKNPKLTQNDGY